MTYGNWTTGTVTYNIKRSFVAKFNQANSTIYSLWLSPNNTIISTLDYNNSTDTVLISMNLIYDNVTLYQTASPQPSYWGKFTMAELDTNLTTLGFTENTTIASIGNAISGLTLTQTSYAAVAQTTPNTSSSSYVVNRTSYIPGSYRWT